jgi:hypothetical protein
MVTHCDLNRAGIDRALAAVGEVLAPPRGDGFGAPKGL